MKGMVTSLELAGMLKFIVNAIDDYIVTDNVHYASFFPSSLAAIFTALASLSENPA